MRTTKMNEAEFRATVEALHRVACQADARIVTLAERALAALDQPEGRAAAVAALRDIIRVSEATMGETAGLADDADGMWFPTDAARAADRALWLVEKRVRHQ